MFFLYAWKNSFATFWDSAGISKQSDEDRNNITAKVKSRPFFSMSHNCSAFYDYDMHYDMKPIIIYLFVVCFFKLLDTLKIFLYIFVCLSYPPCLFQCKLKVQSYLIKGNYIEGINTLN